MYNRAGILKAGRKVVRGVQITFWRVCGWIFFGGPVRRAGNPMEGAHSLDHAGAGSGHFHPTRHRKRHRHPMGDAPVAPGRDRRYHHHGGGVCVGCIVNLWLGWDVWDYSGMVFNILGQVCLAYWMLWVALSLPAIVMFDFMAWRSGAGTAANVQTTLNIGGGGESHEYGSDLCADCRGGGCFVGSGGAEGPNQHQTNGSPAQRREKESRLAMELMYATCSLSLTTAKKLAGSIPMATWRRP